MANNREISQFASFLTVDESANNNVGIATTVRIAAGGLYVDGIEVIGPGGAWRGPNSGLVGAQGAQGAPGAQGAQGTVGAQGTQGAVGAQGNQGRQGTPGSPGAQGNQGYQGRQGAPGAQGAPAAGANGKILQVVSTTKTDKFSTSSTSFVDISGLSVSITPSSTSSKILVIYSVCTAGRNTDYIGTYFQLVRGSTAICIGNAEGSRTRATFAQQNQSEFSQFGGGNFLDSPSTTSATTYKIQMKQVQGQTAYINADNMQNDQNSIYYGRYPSTITVMEVGA